jgi:hypothetical protein
MKGQVSDQIAERIANNTLSAAEAVEKCSVCDRLCLVHGNFRAAYREAVEALEKALLEIANDPLKEQTPQFQYGYTSAGGDLRWKLRAVLAKAREVLK